jgi:hypothetical protein
MTTITWKMVTMYVLGAGIGGFAGALLGSYIADKWIPKEPYLDHLDPTEEEEAAVESLREISESQEEEEEPVVTETKKRTTKIDKNTPKDYTRHFKADREKMSIEEMEREAAKYGAPTNAAMVREPVNRLMPHVINFEEFIAGEDGTDRVTYTYYAKDNTLVDETEEIIPAPADILGNALDKFGMDTDDPDTVYVSNPGEKMFYEVVRLHRSYSEAMVIEQPKKKAVKNGRAK